MNLVSEMPQDIGWIQTYTGGRFYPLNPKPSDVKIEDIAHALSLNNRFTGHAIRGYSVGEHSLLVTKILMDTHEDPTLWLWGLLHDASEAYISDIARPVKQQPEFQFYRDMEANVMVAIMTAFGLPGPEPRAVKAADTMALAIEAETLMPRREKDQWAWLPEIPPQYRHLTLGQDPVDIETQFLLAFDGLQKARNV